MNAAGAAAMLAQTPTDNDWRALQRDCITDVAELWRALDMDPALLDGAKAASRLFPLRMPRRILKQITAGDAHDPVLRQYLPLDAENHSHPGYVTDPVGDLPSRNSPGLLHKYQGRALLITTGACAVHCRYCFRRHYDYAEDLRGGHVQALEAIRRDSGIREVILSGGDPLSLDDDKLAALVQRIASIAHIDTLRIHSRLPVVIPQRITPAFTALLGDTRLKVVFVMHSNHPAELDAEFEEAVCLLKPFTDAMLNQSVLLRGVNDQVEVLADLSHRLFESGILPYYLHQLDPVAGAAHFAVIDAAAKALHRDLAARLPGYLLPRLVREIPGASAKTPLHWTAKTGAAP